MHNLGALAGNGGSTPDRARAEAFIGRVLSRRYRVDTLLAMGGLGAVYVGEHVHMHKRVAIKILHASAQQEPEFVRRFEREAVAGAHVQHPNVAAATDFGEIDQGSYFLVLEYIQGTSLSDLIKRGPMPVPRALHIGRQIAAALEAIHTMGIVHRDLKPLNVMVAEDQGDWVKLIDFGFAKVPVERLAAEDGVKARFDPTLPKRLTRAGTVFGTISYLAPEAAQGMDAIDARADLYALGLMLYEMVAGKLPFEADDPIELFEMQRFQPPPLIAQRAPGVDVPAVLERLILRLLAKDPLRRFESATALLAALDEVAFGLGLDLAGPSRSSRLPGRGAGSLQGVASSVAAPLVPSIPPAPPGPSLPPPGPAARAGAKRRLRLEWIGAGAACAALTLGGIFLAAGGIGQGKVNAAAMHLPAIATPAPPPAPAPAAPERAERAALLAAAGLPDARAAGEALLRLVERDPAALKERPVAAAAREAAVAIGRAGGKPADEVFEALAHRAGTEGLDVLYDVLASRGGTAPAKRAAALLRKPEVAARATPAMRVAFDLRAAGCKDKLELLDRVVAEGDRRALIAIETNVRFCFQNNPKVVGAAQALRDRLGR